MLGWRVEDLTWKQKERKTTYAKYAKRSERAHIRCIPSKQCVFATSADEVRAIRKSSSIRIGAQRLGVEEEGERVDRVKG